MADIRIIDLNDIIVKVDGKKNFVQLGPYTNFVTDAVEGGNRRISYTDLVESIISHEMKVHSSGRGYAVKFDDPDYERERQATLVQYDRNAVPGTIALRDDSGKLRAATPSDDADGETVATVGFVGNSIATFEGIAENAASNAAAAHVSSVVADEAAANANNAAVEARNAAAGVVPLATAETPGTVSVGSGLDVDENGELSVKPFDTYLDSTSANAVQNQVVAAEAGRLSRLLSEKLGVSGEPGSGQWADLKGEPTSTTPDTADRSARVATTEFVGNAMALDRQQSAHKYFAVTLLADRWEHDMDGGGWYSLEERFPSSEWDIQVEVEDDALADERAAWDAARIVGSIAGNVLRADGDVPTTDIRTMVRREPAVLAADHGEPWPEPVPAPEPTFGSVFLPEGEISPFEQTAFDASRAIGPVNFADGFDTSLAGWMYEMVAEKPGGGSTTHVHATMRELSADHAIVFAMTYPDGGNARWGVKLAPVPASEFAKACTSIEFRHQYGALDEIEWTVGGVTYKPEVADVATYSDRNVTALQIAEDMDGVVYDFGDGEAFPGEGSVRLIVGSVAGSDLFGELQCVPSDTISVPNPSYGDEDFDYSGYYQYVADEGMQPADGSWEFLREEPLWWDERGAEGLMWHYDLVPSEPGGYGGDGFDYSGYYQYVDGWGMLVPDEDAHRLLEDEPDWWAELGSERSVTSLSWPYEPVDERPVQQVAAAATGTFDPGDSQGGMSGDVVTAPVPTSDRQFGYGVASEGRLAEDETVSVYIHNNSSLAGLSGTAKAVAEGYSETKPISVSALSNGQVSFELPAGLEGVSFSFEFSAPGAIGNPTCTFDLVEVADLLASGFVKDASYGEASFDYAGYYEYADGEGMVAPGRVPPTVWHAESGGYVYWVWTEGSEDALPLGETVYCTIAEGGSASWSLGELEVVDSGVWTREQWDLTDWSTIAHRTVEGTMFQAAHWRCGAENYLYERGIVYVDSPSSAPAAVPRSFESLFPSPQFAEGLWSERLHCEPRWALGDVYTLSTKPASGDFEREPVPQEFAELHPHPAFSPMLWLEGGNARWVAGLVYRGSSEPLAVPEELVGLVGSPAYADGLYWGSWADIAYGRTVTRAASSPEMWYTSDMALVLDVNGDRRGLVAGGRPSGLSLSEGGNAVSALFPGTAALSSDRSRVLRPSVLLRWVEEHSGEETDEAPRAHLASQSFAYDGLPHHLTGTPTANAGRGETSFEFSADGKWWTSDLSLIEATGVRDSTDVLVRASNPEYASIGGCTARLDIEPRPLLIEGTSGTRTYAGQTVTLEGTSAEGLLEGHSHDATASVAGLTAGTYEGEITEPGLVTVTGGEEDVTANYSVSTRPGVLVVERAPATVTADDKSKRAGEADPELTWTASGLRGRDDASVLSVSVSREPGEEPGSYAIVPAGAAVQGDYDVEFVDGTLTVE